MNHVTHPLSSTDISIFPLEIHKFCYVKKYRYIFHFGIYLFSILYIFIFFILDNI